jgi:hypothetical protein
VTDERAKPGASQDADPRCHRDAEWRRRGAVEGIRLLAGFNHARERFRRRARAFTRERRPGTG